MENLLDAWREFKNGKRNKPDVETFERNLMDNLLQLHRELSDGRYRHLGYRAFKISDPKPRDIHKASVRDRLMHPNNFYLLVSKICEGCGTHRNFTGERFFCFESRNNSVEGYRHVERCSFNSRELAEVRIATRKMIEKILYGSDTQTSQSFFLLWV